MLWTRRTGAVLIVFTLLFAVAMGGVIAWLTGSAFAVVSILGAAGFVGITVAALTLPVSLARRAAAQRRLARRAPLRPKTRPYLIPRELPPPPVFFAGRDAPFQSAVGLLLAGGDNPKQRGPFVLVVHGEAGVGKSGFAIKVATSLIGEFPDGALYASLTGAAYDGQVPNARLNNVIGDLVDSLQGPRDEVPATFDLRQAEFRKLSRERHRRQVLYVYDDVLDEAVARAVMPLGSDAVVLITSRNPLSTVDAQRLVLPPLEWADADHLLRDLLGNPGLDAAHDAALAKVVASAAGYPLALHLAARAISNQGLWALPEMAAFLPEPGVIRDVEVARERMLDLSVATLSRTQRHTLLALAALPDATFVPWMVQAVADLGRAGYEDGDDEAWIICERLADQRLLERITTDATGVVRLRLPDRVRAYIIARAQRELDAQERSAAAQRLEVARQARAGRDIDEVLTNTIPKALNEGRIAAALDEARGALADVRERNRNTDGTRIPSPDERHALGVLAIVLAELGGLDDALEIATVDRKARREAARVDPTVSTEGPRDAADARLRRCLGRLRRREWDLPEAQRELVLAHEIAAQVGDRDEQIWCLRELAIVQSMLTGKPDNHLTQAHQTLDQARALLGGSPNAAFLSGRLTEASALVRINAVTYHGAGLDELNEAIAELDRAHSELPGDYVLWRAWIDYHRARALHQLAASPSLRVGEDARRRQVTQARLLAQRALVAFSNMAHKYGAARCRLEIGSMYAGTEPQAALPLLEEARETFFFCGDRWIEAKTAVVLADVRVSTGLHPAEARAELEFAAALFRTVHDEKNWSRTNEILASLPPAQASEAAIPV